jgi:hypothetical protein
MESRLSLPLCVWGLLGILTFQVPFFVVLLPQIKTSLRLVPGASFVQIENQRGLNVSFDCAPVAPSVNDLLNLSECVNLISSSYGSCPGEREVEYYEAYARLYGTASQFLLNDVQHFTRNPPFVSGVLQWCANPTRLYDPLGTRPPGANDSRFWFDDHGDALSATQWATIFIFGGFGGLLILLSCALEVVLVFFVARWLCLCPRRRGAAEAAKALETLPRANTDEETLVEIPCNH